VDLHIKICLEKLNAVVGTNVVVDTKLAQRNVVVHARVVTNPRVKQKNNYNILK
jgi:hypothetical protein